MNEHTDKPAAGHTPAQGQALEALVADALGDMSADERRRVVAVINAEADRMAETIRALHERVGELEELAGVYSSTSIGEMQAQLVKVLNALGEAHEREDELKFGADYVTDWADYHRQRANKAQERIEQLEAVMRAGINNMGRRCFCCGRVGDWGQSHQKDCPLPAAAKYQSTQDAATTEGPQEQGQ